MNIIEYGDQDLSHLHSKNALRTLNHNTINNDQLFTDPVIDLSLLKKPYSLQQYNSKYSILYFCCSLLGKYRNNFLPNLRKKYYISTTNN